MDATNKCLGGKADTIKVLQSQIKRLELHSRALAENHSTLEAVINSTGLGIWDWHVQTGKAIFNERWANGESYLQ